ncbi:unnamed protein product, partial [Staurois parvus]
MIADPRSDNCRFSAVFPHDLTAGDMYTDHQGTDDQCALMISVAPEVPPVSAHQCQQSVLNSVMCLCPSVPPQCKISVPTSAHQCHISVPIRAALQCHPSVPVSATYQCQSVPPISVHQ